MLLIDLMYRGDGECICNFEKPRLGKVMRRFDLVKVYPRRHDRSCQAHKSHRGRSMRIVTWVLHYEVRPTSAPSVPRSSMQCSTVCNCD